MVKGLKYSPKHLNFLDSLRLLFSSCSLFPNPNLLNFTIELGIRVSDPLIKGFNMI